MSLLTAAGVLVPIVAAFFLLRALQLDTGRGGVLWCAALATGLGLGLSSVTAWAILASGVADRPSFLVADAIVWLAALATLLAIDRRRRGARRHRDGPQADARRRWPMLLALVVLLLAGILAATAFVAQTTVLPHGTWDAWAIWNLKARFFARGLADAAWRDAFSPALAGSHPDYPLLLPLAIARAWVYAGADGVEMPVIVAAVFALAVVAIVGIAVARARGAVAGIVAAAFVMASPAFVKHAPSQCADVPLAFFIVASLAILAEAERRDADVRPWLVAGIAAALGAWTKNEGLLFFVVMAGVCALHWLRQRPAGGRRAALFCLGAAPVLAAVGTFKLLLSPGNDLIAAQAGATPWSKITDAGRVATVARAFAQELWFGGAAVLGILPLLLLYLLLRGWQRPVQPGVGRAAAVLSLSLLAYGLVYLVTPYDLAWHLDSSLSRLILQLVPAIVWAGAMAAR